MKPIAPLHRDARGNDKSARRFPVTDYNYHSISHADLRDSYANARPPSFRSISSDYFSEEAWHDFLEDGALFLAMLGTCAIAISINAAATIDLLRTFAWL
jgi:hypothetical protein